MLLSGCMNLDIARTSSNIAFKPLIGYDTRALESVPFPQDRSFCVWAVNQTTGDNHIPGDIISYSSEGWKSSKQWTLDQMYFEAYWPEDLPMAFSKENGLQLNGFDGTNGNIDILVAKTTEDNEDDDVVILNFDHILSRVEFRMMHSLADGMSVRLKKIVLKGYGQKGDYNTVDPGMWYVKEYDASRIVFESQEGEDVSKGEPLYFGDEFYTIPQICVASVEVSYDVKFADATWIPQVETIDILEVAWESSKHYTYTLNLCMDKLKHTTGISSWSNRE